MEPRDASLMGMVVLMFAGSLASGLWFLWWYRPGEVPPFVSHQERGPAQKAQSHGGARAERREGPLLVAGSGTNLPLMRVLAKHYESAHPGQQPLKVYGSIGSTGGVRAVFDGVVDVGLLSRPLRRKELGLGLLIVPYARVAVVLATHPSVPIKDVSRRVLLSLYAGRKRRWRKQLPVVVLQRERGDSGHLAIGRRLPAFQRVNALAYQRHHWRVLYRDRAMQAALLSQEGAIGVFDLGAIVTQRLPLRALSFAGVMPSVETLAAGRYPFSKTLALALVGRSDHRVLAFLRFLFSAQSRALMKASGYVPIAAPGWLRREGPLSRRKRP